MAEFGKSLREAWIKGMETIGSTANGIADSARYKVERLNLQNRSREIRNSFGTKAYELWKRGEAFPAEMDVLLRELDDVEKMLAAMEAERQTQAAPQAEEAAQEAEPAVEMPTLEELDTEATAQPEPVVEASAIEVPVAGAEQPEHEEAPTIE